MPGCDSTATCDLSLVFESTSLACMLFASTFPCAVIAAVCVCSNPAASLHVLNKRDRKGCPSHSALPLCRLSGPVLSSLSCLRLYSFITSQLPLLFSNIKKKSNHTIVLLAESLRSALRQSSVHSPPWSLLGCIHGHQPVFL